MQSRYFKVAALLFFFSVNNAYSSDKKDEIKEKLQKKLKILQDERKKRSVINIKGNRRQFDRVAKKFQKDFSERWSNINEYFDKFIRHINLDLIDAKITANICEEESSDILFLYEKIKEDNFEIFNIYPKLSLFYYMNEKLFAHTLAELYSNTLTKFRNPEAKTYSSIYIGFKAIVAIMKKYINLYISEVAMPLVKNIQDTKLKNDFNEAIFIANFIDLQYKWTHALIPYAITLLHVAPTNSELKHQILNYIVQYEHLMHLLDFSHSTLNKLQLESDQKEMQKISAEFEKKIHSLGEKLIIEQYLEFSNEVALLHEEFSRLLMYEQNQKIKNIRKNKISQIKQLSQSSKEKKDDEIEKRKELARQKFINHPKTPEYVPWYLGQINNTTPGGFKSEVQTMHNSKTEKVKTKKLNTTNQPENDEKISRGNDEEPPSILYLSSNHYDTFEDVMNRKFSGDIFKIKALITNGLNGFCKNYLGNGSSWSFYLTCIDDSKKLVKRSIHIPHDKELRTEHIDDIKIFFEQAGYTIKNVKTR